MNPKHSFAFFWYRIGVPIVTAVFGAEIVIQAIVSPTARDGSISAPVVIAGLLLIVLAIAGLVVMRRVFLKRDGRWF